MTGSTKSLSLALTLALVVVASGPTLGAQAVPATSPASPQDSELQELDEVVVYGERLITRIITAEDEFYKLYNQLNKDDRYDVSCPFLTLGADSGSRINSRLCLPGFVADAIADFAVFKAACEPTLANFDANRDRRVSRMEAAAHPELNFRFDEFDQNDDEQLDEHVEFKAFENWALTNQNCYRPPPPDLVLMEGTEAWYKHMLVVANSDPRLSEMAGRLDDLHRELGSVRRRFGDMTRQEAEAGYVDRTPDMRQAGPRH